MPTWSVAPSHDEMSGDELADPPLRRREVVEIGGGEIVDRLDPVVVDEEIDATGRRRCSGLG